MGVINGHGHAVLADERRRGDAGLPREQRGLERAAGAHPPAARGSAGRHRLFVLGEDGRVLEAPLGLYRVEIKI